jgi:hypothetical protein
MSRDRWVLRVDEAGLREMCIFCQALFMLNTLPEIKRMLMILCMTVIIYWFWRHKALGKCTR